MQTPRQKIVFRRLDGILLLDKPQGMSSNASLQLARRLLRAQKGGHTGSLDPLATGLLPLCFGEATKIAGLLLGAAKAYEAGIRLGVATDTDDAHGQVLRERAVPMFDDAALRAALAPFIGRIRQRAPVYSALKRGGEPLYARARRGEAIDAPEREVEVQGIDLLGREGADLRLRVTCGSGTYIRSIARDLGEVLGCGAHITALRRLWVEPFMQPAMQRLDELEAMDEAGRAACLLPLDAGLAGFPQVRLDAELESRFRQGQHLRLPADASADGLVAVAGPDGVVGLGQVSAGLLAPQRLFNLPGVDASRCTSH